MTKISITNLPLCFALLVLASTSEAANLRSSILGIVEDSYDGDFRPPSEDTPNNRVVADNKGLTQSECLSETYPYAKAVVDAMHARAVQRDMPLVGSATEGYQIVAAAIRETDERFPDVGPEDKPRFLCVSGMDDLYCVRNCQYPDLLGRPFCQARANQNSTWVANWANRELQGSNDTRFRILDFHLDDSEQPVGEEILLIDAVGRGFARERYYWNTNGWLLDPPAAQDTDNNNCLGCPSSVLTETYTRGYTLKGSNSPVRQGIATAGVTLPDLPEGYEVTSTVTDRSDPAYIHPMYDRINAICPCC